MSAWEGDVRELREGVAGPVFLFRGVSTTDGATHVAEAAADNPLEYLESVIAVGATSVADVQAVVRFAARHHLPVAIRATGRQVVRIAHGAVLINTSRMHGVHVDKTDRTARVEAGVRWKTVVDEAARYGLAPMSGSSPEAGVVGYTLGAGQSSLGSAADHVREIEVVTADGELRHVTADGEPDLFWALRGGKGNFGVVTAITFDLMEETTSYGGSLYLPARSMADVLPIWRTWAGSLPERATTSVAVERIPVLAEILPEMLGNAFVLQIRFAFLGPAAEGERLIAPIRAISPLLIDQVYARPYAESAMIDLDTESGTPLYSWTTTLRELSDEVLDAFIEVAGPEPDCPLTMVEIRPLGGASDREPPVPNAVPALRSPYVVNAFGIGGPDEDLLNARLHRLGNGLAPWEVDGLRTVNFVGGDEDAGGDRVRLAYGAQRQERLARVQRRFDPANMFRMNHDIALW
ncbi:FAD-binding oxidoreductase [Actinoplanes sp. TBRC 11911]|nr:FAD-binding oxidoreductase [Actinoplanes sp. TBRC 11911]